MAEQFEHSGFFNAQETNGTYDRTYDANDFAEYFSLFIGNGVFINPTNQLKVVPKSGLTVTLKQGSAFIDGYWYRLEEDMDFTLSPNGTSFEITDTIAITLDKSSRLINARKKENVSDTKPVNNGTVHELVVAVIKIGVGVSVITDSVITDTRPDESYCGFVSGTVEQIDTTDLFSQFQSAFDIWFEKVKNQLDEDAAGNLQNQIDDLFLNVSFLEDVYNYRKGEQAVGEWIDGKTIYRRVFVETFTESDLSEANGVLNGRINTSAYFKDKVDTFIKLDVINKGPVGSVGQYCEGTDPSNDYFRIYYYAQDGNISFTCGKQHPGRPFELIIIAEYTKL